MMIKEINKQYKLEEVTEVIESDVSRDEMLEEISKLETITTDLTRMIFVDEIEFEEGDVVSGLGHHWSNLNDDNFGNNGGYLNDDLIDTKAIFYVDDVKGYKVPYFHEIWAENNNVSYENRMQLVDEWDDFYTVLGTDEDAYGEAEVLVSNDTKFKVVDIFEPNSETNYYEIYLEVI